MDKKSRKSNGYGHTYRVGNSWKTVIEVGGRRVTATNKSKQESRRLAREKAQKASSINKGTVFGAQNLKFGEHLTHWLENVHRNRIAHSTYRRYSGLAKHYVLPALGNIPIQRVSKKEILHFMNSMSAQNIGPRTKNQALALLSASFDGAIEAGFIDVNPAGGVNKSPEPPTKILPLDEKEVNKLLVNSAGTYMHARLHLAFMGLRQGEALGLCWQNVDLQKGVVHIVQQAQKIDGSVALVGLKSPMSNRVLHLSESTREALNKHRTIVAKMRLAAGEKWEDKDLVFPNKNGGFLQQKVDYARWIRALALSDISARRLHDARHTAGTLLFAHGEGIETIRRFLGHSTVNLTSRTYVHNAEAPMKSAAQTLNKVLGITEIA